METGVYQIRNLLNGDLYVGSAQITFKRRRTQHWSALRKNKHHSIHLQRAILKYGLENFVFEVLERCELPQCLEREQYWIDTLKPSYNINPIARSGKGSTRSEESKARIREARRKCVIVLTEEGRKAISDTHKGIPKTKEHIEKVAASQRKAVVQMSLSGEIMHEYESAKHAMRANNWKSYVHIGNVCRGDRKSAYGFKWKYKDARR